MFKVCTNKKSSQLDLPTELMPESHGKGRVSLIRKELILKNSQKCETNLVTYTPTYQFHYLFELVEHVVKNERYTYSMTILKSSLFTFLGHPFKRKRH